MERRKERLRAAHLALLQEMFSYHGFNNYDRTENVGEPWEGVGVWPQSRPLPDDCPDVMSVKRTLFNYPNNYQEGRRADESLGDGSTKG